jgi:uncharacterized repeat protein (TIGR01451 family)
MIRTWPTVGRATLAAGLILWAGGAARAQQETDLPPVPPGLEQVSLPEAPGLAKAPLSAQPTRAPAAKPAASAPRQLPGTLPSSGATPPAAAAEAGESFQDVQLGAGEGPTPANPTGMQEPGVSLQWICPPTAKLHQQVNCTIIVKSLSANRLHHVTVRYRVPAGVTVKGTEPQAVADGEFYVWQLGNLEPRQEKRLDVHLLPTAKGPLACNAFVTFTGSSTARLEVREPRLTLAASAPKQAVRGDPATVVLTVSNPGDAPAEHVKVKATLSDGLEHPGGKTVEFDLDSLGPNEGRTVLVQCAARTPGPQVCAAVATGEPALSATDSASIEVLDPKVELAVSGPGMRYLDRHAVYVFKVTNPGTAPANHVTLTDQVPPGFKVVGATGGGRHDFASRAVVWFLGDLPPGKSREVSLDLVAVNPGEYKNKATVTAARGLRAEGEVQTRLEGLPGLLMELVDIEDPVEVGRDDSYEIRVANTGTKTETNLQLTCTIPEKMEYAAAKAPAGCTVKVQGRDVVFSPLPKLAPRADVIYRVSVHCKAAGDLRFQARVRADGLEQPVLREESTRVYGDERETRPATPPTGN